MQAGPVSADVDEGHDDIDLFPLGGDSLHHRHDRGQVVDHVDALGVVPAARDGGGEIKRFLVVGVDQLDLLAKHAAAKILNRHFRGFDRPLAVKVGECSGLIGEYADLDALRRGRRAHKHTAGGDDGGPRAGRFRVEYAAAAATDLQQDTRRNHVTLLDAFVGCALR